MSHRRLPEPAAHPVRRTTVKSFGAVGLLVALVLTASCEAGGANDVRPADPSTATSGGEGATGAPWSAGELLQADPDQFASPDPVRSAATRACPRRARDAERLVEQAEPPTAYRALFSAVLCRYAHSAEGTLMLEGAVPVDFRTAEALHRAYRDRSLAMVDCEPQPRPLFAVLDRDGQEQPRVVTVDLGLCGSIEALVPGPLDSLRSTYGLATQRHMRLLQEAWQQGQSR